MWTDKQPEYDGEQAVAQAALDAAQTAYYDADNAWYKVRQEMQAKVDAVYQRALARYEKQYADRMAAAETVCHETRAAYEDAERALKALRYRPGLHPISHANNMGECIISPEGLVYMIPQYEDHSDVFDKVTAGKGTPSRWVRVEARGSVSDAYHGDLDVDTLTSAQVSSLDAVAGLHDAYAEQSSDVYDKECHARYANRIREYLYPAPSDDEFTDEND